MPYTSMKAVPPSLKGIRPAITLEQANEIAAMADAIAAGDNPPDSPWAVAISQWKKAHTVRKGVWVKREKTQEATSKMTSPVMEADKVTKTEAGKSFPASDYAYVPDSESPSTWKLRLTAEPGGTPDSGIVGAAIAALGKGFRGNKVEIPAADLPAVKAKVRAAWKKANPDKKPEEMPPAIKEAAANMAECGPYDTGPTDEFIPMDIVSLSQLTQQRAARDTTEETQELFEDVMQLARNILYSPAELVPDKPAALRALIDELALALPDMAANNALSANAENPPMAEAATIKNKVKAAIKALDALLEDKDVPSHLRTHVKDLREAMGKTWADLANDAQQGSPRQSESEPQTATTQHNEPGGPGGGVESLCESYAGSVDMLTEADGKGEALAINIRPIRVGPGNSKDLHYYDGEMLRTNASKLVGAKMYETDHKQNEKSTRTWVSTITELKGFESDGSPIMKVAIHDPDFAQRVKNLEAAKDADGKSLLSKLECSLLASGTAKTGTREGKQYKVVESITDVQSVDWVTRAGAGGGALSIAETASTSIPTQEGVIMTNQTPAVEVTTTTITPVIEATAPIEETTVTTTSIVQPEGTVINIEAEPTYLESTAIQEILGKSNLPQVAKDKLAKGRYQKIEEVETAVKEETEYLKEIRGSGRPFGQGNSSPQKPQTPAEYDTAISEIIKKYTAK